MILWILHIIIWERSLFEGVIFDEGGFITFKSRVLLCFGVKLFLFYFAGRLQSWKIYSMCGLAPCLMLHCGWQTQQASFSALTWLACFFHNLSTKYVHPQKLGVRKTTIFFFFFSFFFFLFVVLVVLYFSVEGQFVFVFFHMDPDVYPVEHVKGQGVFCLHFSTTDSAVSHAIHTALCLPSPLTKFYLTK